MKFNMENIVVDGDPKLRMPSVDIKVPVSDTDLELIQAMVDFVKRSQTDQLDDTFNCSEKCVYEAYRLPNVAVIKRRVLIG